jgi:hypothetical protein
LGTDEVRVTASEQVDAQFGRFGAERRGIINYNDIPDVHHGVDRS